MIRRPPRSTQSRSSAASDVYKRQGLALHLGHRISGDLEFYTQQVFRPSNILEELQGFAGVVEAVTMGDDSMTVQADGARLLLTQTPARFAESTTKLNGCDVAGAVSYTHLRAHETRHEL